MSARLIKKAKSEDGDPRVKFKQEAIQLYKESGNAANFFDDIVEMISRFKQNFEGYDKKIQSKYKLEGKIEACEDLLLSVKDGRLGTSEPAIKVRNSIQQLKADFTKELDKVSGESIVGKDVNEMLLGRLRDVKQIKRDKNGKRKLKKDKKRVVKYGQYKS